MKKKLFVISDIHGHYQFTINELARAGYDEKNNNHLLIVCGDCFDRGSESLAIYQWLRPLQEGGKAIIVRGNHEELLEKYLDGSSISPFNYIHNGTNETLADFLGQTSPFETWCLCQHIEQPTYGDFATWIGEAIKEINEDELELLPWLKSLPYYYETKNYIFTHAIVNGTCGNWKEPPEGWRELTWASPNDLTKPIVNTDKTVVVGHINGGRMRELYGENGNDNSIFTRPDGKVIVLDACTILTKKVNVLVLEDDVLL